MLLNTSSTNKEDILIQHTIASISNATEERSSLNQTVLQMQGMSSPKVRHLLNNLCSIPDTCYLEIGSWKGSTLAAAIHGNLAHAIAIDNWSEFGAPKNEFIRNMAEYLNSGRLKFIEADCFTIDKHQVFDRPVNIYFYDGNHSQSNQKNAFVYFNDVFDDVFVAVVDDWNDQASQIGTREAIKELNYQILFEIELFTCGNGDINTWWNGLYVAVLKK
jgi:hypothetical protein